ncbi:hypothetical protein CPCC7001_1727 [Cyanobium sp. PCC 7001]|nr:hypothetical protein CPCC7001_1727 [Cyanobium sp. PCC 7001]
MPPAVPYLGPKAPATAVGFADSASPDLRLEPMALPAPVGLRHGAH